MGRKRFTGRAYLLTGLFSAIKNSPALSGFLQNNLNLLPQEKSELIAFLKMLTDSAFINNPKFAAPTINR